MTHLDPYISVIIGMIGIAYPILLQVISSFDTKYSNEKITNLFQKELIYKLFKYSLYSSLIFVGIWSLGCEPPKCFKSNNELFNEFIDNSASIFLAINGIVLVILFFCLLEKVIIYLSALTLIPYLIKKYVSVEKDDQYFDVLKDLFLSFIKTEQHVFLNTLSEFFNTCFQKIRRNSFNSPVVYPNSYYILVHQAIEELANLKDKRNIKLEYKTSGGLWLMGQISGYEISNLTYNWIWNNLLLAIRYNQEDLIMHHWENFHQYFSLNLRFINPNFVQTIDSYQVTNLEDVEKRKEERKKAIEFHLALGALLLYKKRNSTLKEIFEYTQSEPARYELFPNSIFEILSFYVKFKDPYDREYYQLYMNYSFPNARGINGEKVVKNWICNYITILYVRHFTLGSIPPPDKIDKPDKNEIKVWIDRLKELNFYLEELYSEKDFLIELNIEYLAPEFFGKVNLPNPISYLKTYISELEKIHNINLETAIIDPIKVANFQQITNSNITEKIEIINQVNLFKKIFDRELDKWYVNGLKTVVEKDFLAKDSQTEYLNLNSILAENISENLTTTFKNTFLFKTSISYLVKPEEILLFVQKLNLDKSYAIINFGIDLSGLNIDPEVTIISFDEKRLGSQVLYVLKKINLPSVTTLPLDQEIVKKYKLDCINEKLNIYTTNVSLNDVSEEIYNENKGNRPDDEMRKSILLGVFLKAEITWNKNIDVIQIRRFSIYSIAELPNSIEDLKPIN